MVNLPASTAPPTVTVHDPPTVVIELLVLLKSKVPDIGRVTRYGVAFKTVIEGIDVETYE